MDAGLFVGRFQPFHLGHLSTVKFALDKVRYLIIAVGSAQKSHERRNPFTSGERITMIKSALMDEAEVDLDRVMIIPLPDADVHRLWTASVRSLVPPFDVVFTNDDFTAALFRADGALVERSALTRRNVLSGTAIRAMIEQGDSGWQRLVPEAVFNYVTSIGGADRLKTIADVQASTSHGKA